MSPAKTLPANVPRVQMLLYTQHILMPRCAFLQNMTYPYTKDVVPAGLPFQETLNYRGGTLAPILVAEKIAPMTRGVWASRTRESGEAGGGRPEDGGAWAAKTVKRPPQQPAQPRHANYWAPLMHKRPQPAQPQHTNYWAPRTRTRHQQEHRPQRPTERSDPTQHAKGRTGDCPGPRKETTPRRNVTRGGGGLRPGLSCHLVTMRAQSNLWGAENPPSIPGQPE